MLGTAYHTRYLFFLTEQLSCSLQPSHLHRTHILCHFLLFCLMTMKGHFPLLFFIDKSCLIEELKQIRLITPISFIQQLDID